MKADLHIHTVLSPCGDLEMSPVNIINKATSMGLSIIAITDHNSTKQAPIIQKYGLQHDITVILGVEVNTREEVHCLAYFPTLERLNAFQQYLDKFLPYIPNNPEKFGYQVVVDTDENILYEENRYLVSAIDQDIESVEKAVHQLDGIFIPAHINKSFSSIISQLGFVPPSIACDALELSRHITPEKFLQENMYLKNYAFIQSSDAHYIDDIGKTYTEFCIKDTCFETIRKAIKENFLN